MAASVVAFALLTSWSFFALSDGHGVIHVHDGVTRIGWPWVLFEEGGFAWRRAFYAWAAVVDLAFAIILSATLFAIWKIANQHPRPKPPTFAVAVGLTFFLGSGVSFFLRAGPSAAVQGYKHLVRVGLPFLMYESGDYLYRPRIYLWPFLLDLLFSLALVGVFQFLLGWWRGKSCLPTWRN